MQYKLIFTIGIFRDEITIIFTIVRLIYAYGHIIITSHQRYKMAKL